MTSLANAAGAEINHGTSASKLSAVRAWLLIVAAFIFAIVLIGGATRLTGSGLSITEWQPILGVVPPSTEAAWQEAFAKYRQIPEYELVNRGMSLDSFKTIYWWEWTHRLLARLAGFVFLIPFVYFLVRGSIPRPFISRVAALFILGGAQGALGWFMVRSGLSGRVDVSQYRLAAHLALAVAIGSYAFWLALSIGDQHQTQDDVPRFSRARLGAGILAGLVYLQIIAGAFVAGLKAGHASSTWPLMNGEFIPQGMDTFSPWWLNFFENPITAQFTHRTLGYAIAIFGICFGGLVLRHGDTHRLRLPIASLIAAILLQIALGVATIVYGVPLGIALAHQANAIIVLGLSLWAWHRAAGRFENHAAARA